MHKAETRASSRGKFQYQELSFSNPRRRKARVSLSPIRSAIVTNTLTRSISTPPDVRSQPRLPSTHIDRSLVYMALHMWNVASANTHTSTWSLFAYSS